MAHTTTSATSSPTRAANGSTDRVNETIVRLAPCEIMVKKGELIEKIENVSKYYPSYGITSKNVFKFYHPASCVNCKFDLKPDTTRFGFRLEETPSDCIIIPYIQWMRSFLKCHANAESFEIYADNVMRHVTIGGVDCVEHYWPTDRFEYRKNFNNYLKRLYNNKPHKTKMATTNGKKTRGARNKTLTNKKTQSKHKTAVLKSSTVSKSRSASTSNTAASSTSTEEAPSEMTSTTSESESRSELSSTSWQPDSENESDRDKTGHVVKKTLENSKRRGPKPKTRTTGPLKEKDKRKEKEKAKKKGKRTRAQCDHVKGHKNDVGASPHQRDDILITKPVHQKKKTKIDEDTAQTLPIRNMVEVHAKPTPAVPTTTNDGKTLPVSKAQKSPAFGARTWHAAKDTAPPKLTHKGGKTLSFKDAPDLSAIVIDDDSDNESVHAAKSPTHAVPTPTLGKPAVAPHAKTPTPMSDGSASQSQSSDKSVPIVSVTTPKVMASTSTQPSQTIADASTMKDHSTEADTDGTVMNDSATGGEPVAYGEGELSLGMLRDDYAYECASFDANDDSIFNTSLNTPLVTYPLQPISRPMSRATTPEPGICNATATVSTATPKSPTRPFQRATKCLPAASDYFMQIRKKVEESLPKSATTTTATTPFNSVLESNEMVTALSAAPQEMPKILRLFEAFAYLHNSIEYAERKKQIHTILQPTYNGLERSMALNPVTTQDLKDALIDQTHEYSGYLTTLITAECLLENAAFTRMLPVSKNNNSNVNYQPTSSSTLTTNAPTTPTPSSTVISKNV